MLPFAICLSMVARMQKRRMVPIHPLQGILLIPSPTTSWVLKMPLCFLDHLLKILFQLWGPVCTKDCDSAIWEPVGKPDPVAIEDGSDDHDDDASDASPPPELPEEKPKLTPFNSEAFIPTYQKEFSHGLMTTWGEVTLTNICFVFSGGTKHQLSNYSPFVFQDPAGFSEALDGGVSPVNVAGNKKRRRVKGKGKRSKKAKTSKSKGSQDGLTVPESKADVLGSFPDMYQNIIKSLPVCLWPTSSKHGEHSYTVLLG